MKVNCKGHTLIELLISMSLSMLIIAALIPVNTFSLRSIVQIQKTKEQINLLGQSLMLMETDLKSAALSGCALDKALVKNSIVANDSAINWISGYSNNSWFPETPEFANHDYAGSFDALQFVKVDMSELISLRSLTKTPGRILFVTNCLEAEISRKSDSRLLENTSSTSDLSIYAFQFIQYYIKENLGRYTLYRQYLSKSGKPRNEPLVDNINQLKIGYAEKLSNSTLAFKTAANVNNWSDIIAVYISITLKGAIAQPFSTIVLLSNHVP